MDKLLILDRLYNIGRNNIDFMISEKIIEGVSEEGLTIIISLLK